MNCAISGEVPEVPVVSRKTGHLFERRLIEKYIDAEGKCPITGEPLGVDDLMDVKSNKVVRPRPATATSIPGLLALMQNEWDDLMVETYTLKQHLDTTRQELSQALYQQDASARVIARLMRERDEARQQLQAQRAALAQAAAAGAPAAEVAPMEVEPAVVEDIPAKIADTVMSELTNTWKALTKSRKKRVIPVDLVSADDMANWVEASSQTLHKTTPAGITCLALSPQDASLTLTGGVDKTAILFNRESGVQSALLSGHSKKVLDVAFGKGGEVLLTASADGTAKSWDLEGMLLHTFQGHKGEVTAICGHPTGRYAATAGRDKAWGFHELESGSCLRLVKEEGFEAGYECARWHPDGLILGTGTGDAQVRIWDMKTQNNVASFKGHEGGVVGSIAFSENGYYMASGGSDGTARLWDLRKLKNFHTLTLGSAAGTPVVVTFDHSGTYLAVSANTTIQVHVVKEWALATTLGQFKKPITGVAFAPSAKSLAATSMDRTLRFFEAAE
ncbi:WD40-repeat-containing domain protein [Tribonema minus]|uniref:Pre-mRNA-processing factor 19 n=1 Tax=Tribonema minus TaxID=303371 RepID=A0A835YI40_9STRA|nr:WD40-repeat-containing domain protein [Tribonema minus]